MFRRTKIVATVGPSCSSASQLDKLLGAGVDVFRLNFSHGGHADKTVVIDQIRNLSKQHQRAVAILGDLQGPKIRAGLMKNGGMELIPDTDVRITTRDVLGEGCTIPTIFEDLPKDVKPGDRILLDDGLMELKALSIDGTDVICRVITGGLLKDRKGINLPGVAISAPALTIKDKEDLLFCIEKKLDYIALSFVRNAADVETLRRILDQYETEMKIVSKIEKPEAIDNFDQILEISDGIMVARGDLGVEIRPEKVPLIQKKIIHKCNQAGKPVITATQMLESMVTNPRPTRAETSDVANAIFDGTDAVMLSAETASGNHPLESVTVMAKVASDVEQELLYSERPFFCDSNRDLTEAIGQAACQLANYVEAKAILAFTQTGNTAALVAKYRPGLPIYAVTPSHTVRRRMALFSGVRSIRVAIEGTTEAQIRSVEQAVLQYGVLKKDDVVVITMGSPLSDPGTTNLLKVHRLGEPLKNSIAKKVFPENALYPF